jgi:phosphohistidine phosphatase
VDLILWRHAFARRLDQPESASAQEDWARELTAKGHTQAKLAAKWLKLHLSASTRVLVSPALRCQQTAAYLEMETKTLEALGPGQSADEILQALKWPQGKSPVLVVGHQPALGAVLAKLLGCELESMPVRKAGVWWLRHRERDGVGQTTVVAVVPPDMTH